MRDSDDSDPNSARTTPVPIFLSNVCLGDISKAYGAQQQFASYQIRAEVRLSCEGTLSKHAHARP